MGFEEEIGGRSRDGEWRLEREGEAQERMNDGVAVGGDWRQERKGELRC
ncbi:hypothetical protein TIFTF001_022573 [Ficus carica]|uniref:Uncharacterized protein n=1 Tax=Ficus carica TaxID=3494 RepID=A0AA88AJE3_FICCA|nr:hypothetical protein TIFTF001_022573 [Ficus carica]